MKKNLISALEEALALTKYLTRKFPESKITIGGEQDTREPPVTLHIEVDVFKDIISMNNTLTVESYLWASVYSEKIFVNSIIFNGVKITCETKKEWG